MSEAAAMIRAQLDELDKVRAVKPSAKLCGLWDDYCEASTANGSTDNGAIDLYDIDGMFEAARAIFDAATVAEARLAAVEAERDRMREALTDLLNAACGPVGFAEAVRHNSGKAYPWPSLDAAEEKARAALTPKPTEGETP